MEYLYAFLYGAIICLIGQIILDNTKLTPGHLTTLYVIIGAFLGFFGIYDKILSLAHAGANLPITSFGNLLFNASYNGFLTNGFLGLFTNMYVTTSGVITASIVFSLLISLFFKVKD